MSKRFFTTLAALLLLCLLAACIIAATVMGERFVEQKLDSAINQVRHRAVITYQDLDIDFVLLDLTLSGLGVTLAQGPHFTIDTLTVKDVDYHHPRRPLYLTLSLQGVSMDVSQENMGPAFEDFAGLGYSHITFNVLLDYRLDAFSNTMRLSELRITAPGVGSMRMTFDLSNFHMDQIMGGRFDNIIIEDFFLHYSDDSLVKKLFSIAAETEPEFVDFFIDGLQEDLEEARQDYDEHGARSIKELIDFLRNPARLAITVDLQRPIVIRNIMLFKKISELLTLFRLTFDSGPEL